MNTISALNDKFSWRRCLSIGLLYKKSLIYYLIGSATITALCFLLVEFVNHSGGNALAVYSMTNVLVAATLYFSPIAFVRRDDTLMSLLPVKTSEKFVFYLLFSLIVAPIVIEGIWYGLNFIFTLINKDWDLTDIVYAQLSSMGSEVIEILGEERKCPLKAYQILTGIAQAFAIIITGLYTVFHASYHRTIKGILAAITVIIAICLIAGITGGILAATALTSGVSPEKLTGTIMQMMMPYMILLSVLCIIYGLFIACIFYRLLATRQAKN